MGLNRHSLNIILNLEDYGITGVDFNKIMTIGRQGLHESKRSIDELLKPMDLTISDYDYCEDLFFKLNAEVIDSIDFSNYENASIIHDMNSSIPKDLHAFYDLVIDAGSLEHVFNFPVALKNCMEMVKVGGHFIGVFPIDNFCGHGFYQFSPELFFRCFSQENGFKSLKMFLYQEKDLLFVHLLNYCFVVFVIHICLIYM